MEGACPPGEAYLTIPAGTTLRGLLSFIKERDHFFASYLFDRSSGRPAVRLALVNGVSFRDESFADCILGDGDRVFFILPLSGG